MGSSNFWGAKGSKIAWRGTSKKEILKYFDLIRISGKRTVKQMLNDGSLKPGDIVTYHKICHTNVYAGGNMWYDAGHAYCHGSGQGAVFYSWKGTCKHLDQPVGCILRQKYAGKKMHIVQVGAFLFKNNAYKQTSELKNLGFDCVVKKIDGKWIVQCGAFKDLANAEERVRQLKNAGFDAVIK